MTFASQLKTRIRKIVNEYNKFCDELGVDKGACRGCVPVVKFDPEKEDKPKRKQDDKV